MSEATRDALEQALTNHISDEAGRAYLVTGYVIGTAVTSFEGEHTGGHAGAGSGVAVSTTSAGRDEQPASNTTAATTPSQRIRTE